MNQHTGKTHCLRGHAFTAENTRLVSTGHRGCKACARMTTRTRRKREREALREDWRQ